MPVRCTITEIDRIERGDFLSNSASRGIGAFGFGECNLVEVPFLACTAVLGREASCRFDVEAVLPPENLESLELGAGVTDIEV